MKNTATIIKRFAAAPLFQHVGEPLDDDRVQPVHDWKSALRPRIRGPGSELYDVTMNRIRTLARTKRGDMQWHRAGHFPAGWVGELPSEDDPDPDRLPELYRDGTLYVY